MTSPVFVNLSGMSGVTSMNTMLLFPIRRKCWEEFLDPPEEKEMRCANGAQIQ